MLKLPQKEVLCYRKGRRDSKTVRRHYIAWRESQNPPLPMRCDNKKCKYYSESLVWNGKELKMVLDHKNGVNGDNRPENLRFLCPNCNAQLSTHGGGNKGRVNQSEGGFSTKQADGKYNYTLPAEPGDFSLKGSEAKMEQKE